MMPTNYSYWFADTLGMKLGVTKKGITGKAKLKVPTFDPLRLVCPVEAKASMYRPKEKSGALLVKIRGDLYLLLAYDGISGWAWIIDGTKLRCKPANVMKRVMSLDVLADNIKPAVVDGYTYSKKENGWLKLAANMG